MRRRRKISSIFYELGPVIATRAYRMKPSSFWKIHKKLLLHLYTSTNNKKRKRGKTPNGDISTVTRLSIALRYFFGGCPFDISLVHGVSHVEVFHSIWKVVDAVNQCNDLAFSFPPNHFDQQNLASEFAAKSGAGFTNCVAAIDGILVWTQQPYKDECEISGCGKKKFFCGREKNMD